MIQSTGNNVLRSEGHALLTRAAEEAAAQWVFPPTLVDDSPVRLPGYIVSTSLLTSKQRRDLVILQQLTNVDFKVRIQ